LSIVHAGILNMWLFARGSEKNGLGGPGGWIEGMQRGEEENCVNGREDVSFCIFVTLDDAKNACYAQSIPTSSLLVEIAGYHDEVSLYIRRRQTVGMLRVMSRRGDDRIIWDSKKAQAKDPEAMAAIREAERIFNEERVRGATTFRVETGKPVERIEKFDRTAEQIVIVPRVVGG
jgi:hypothetical protein